MEGPELKIALLADAHANSVALEAVLRDIERQEIRYSIFAGDAVGYYPYVNEVCNMLRNHVDLCIKGNHDAFVTGRLHAAEGKRKAYALDYTLKEISRENMAWLTDLPEFLEIEIEGKVFRIYHGSPWDHLEEYIYPDYGFFERFDTIRADYVILGHTHHPMHSHMGRKIIINPGSCGQPRDYDPRVSYALLEIQSGDVTIRRVPYDVQSVIDHTTKLDFDESVQTMLLRTRERLCET